MIESPPIVEVELVKNDFTSQPAESPADDWLLWQLADSAFPTGGFAHSGGLEAAWKHGEIKNSAELQAFVEAALVQLVRGMLPFMISVYDEPRQFSDCDLACDSFITNHVANRASRLQGRALFASVRRIFGSGDFFNADSSPKFGHLSPVFGLMARALKIERQRACNLFLFWHLRGWMASAVRLGVIGPNEAQAMQFSLGRGDRPRMTAFTPGCFKAEIFTRESI
jgi:urease accessory protein